MSDGRTEAAQARNAATERVLRALRDDVDRADEDLLICHPSALTLAGLRCRRANPLDAPNPFGWTDVAEAEKNLEQHHVRILRNEGFEP